MASIPLPFACGMVVPFGAVTFTPTKGSEDAWTYLFRRARAKATFIFGRPKTAIPSYSAVKLGQKTPLKRNHFRSRASDLTQLRLLRCQRRLRLRCRFLGA